MASLLFKCMRFPDEPQYLLGKVCFYLGITGSAVSLEPTKAALLLQPMTAVAERKRPRQLEEEDLNDIKAALWGIGFLGTDAALNYLKRAATEAYWLERPMQSSVPGYGWDEARTRKSLQVHVINCIAMAGNEAAKEVLRELRRSLPPDVRLMTTIDGCLKVAEKRRTGAHLLERGKYAPTFETP